MSKINTLIFYKDPDEVKTIQAMAGSINVSFHKVTNESEILPSLNNLKPDLLIYRFYNGISEHTLMKIRNSYGDSNLKIILLVEQIDKKQLEFFIVSIKVSDIYLIPLEVNYLKGKFEKILEELQAKKIDKVLAGQVDNNLPKCMLVDNDRYFRNIFNEILSKTFNILFAENGEDALKLFVQHNPNIIFLTENIKLINEKVISQKIKSIDPEGKIKLYYLSTVMKPTLKPTILFDAIIEKSYDQVILTKHLMQLIPIEKDNCKKVSSLVRHKVPEFVRKDLVSVFSQKTKKNITILNKTETFTVKNEILFINELNDVKQKFSLTIGLWASENDTRNLLDFIKGEIIPFNQEASDTIRTSLEDIISNVKSFFHLEGVELVDGKSKLLNKTENKLDYDWDSDIVFKTDTNEIFSLGMYCSKIV